MLDSRVVLGPTIDYKFPAGSEIVFYLDTTGNIPVYQNGGIMYSKAAWNSDSFSGDCNKTSSSFNKTFYLGTYNCTTATCGGTDCGHCNAGCGPSRWLDNGAVTRLAAAPLYLALGNTTKNINIYQGQTNVPHCNRRSA